MGRSRGGAGAVVLACLSWTAGARADGAVRLAYAADAGCPGEELFVDLVRARVGRDPFEADAADEVRVRLTRNEVESAAELAVVRAGEAPRARLLRAGPGECEELATSIAVMVGILLVEQEQAQEQEQEPEQEQEQEQEQEPEQEQEQEQEPEQGQEQEQERAVEVRIGGGVAASYGATAEVGVGPALGFAVVVGAFRIGLGGTIEIRPGASSVAPGARMESIAYGGRIELCGVSPPFRVCGVATLGTLQARVTGVALPRSRASLAAGVGALAGLDIQLGRRLSLEPSFELLAAVARPAVELDGAQAWLASPVVARLRLELLVRFR